jgi:hypothetical protein
MVRYVNIRHGIKAMHEATAVNGDCITVEAVIRGVGFLEMPEFLTV